MNGPIRCDTCGGRVYGAGCGMSCYCNGTPGSTGAHRATVEALLGRGRLEEAVALQFSGESMPTDDTAADDEVE